MKKATKILSIILAAIIAFSAFSISSFAVATELEAGNSKETATNIPKFGVEYVSSLSKAGEADWFKFTTLPDDAYYTYTLKNYNMPYYDYGEVGNDSIAPNIFIYDSFLQQVTFSYNNSSRNFKLEPNTVYFVKVLNGDKKSTGNYSIKFDYQYDSVPNEKANATKLPLNESSINTFDGWCDVDWFKFSTTVNGKYTFKLKNHNLTGYKDDFPYGTTTKTPNIVVYDKYDLTLGSSNNNTTFTVELEANTEYYIKMFMGFENDRDIGTYEISVTSPDYNAQKLTSIALVSAPEKTVYSIGEAFGIDSLNVEATYSDGTKKTIEGYSISGFDSSTAGTKTITVSYTENGITKTCQFNITVIVPAEKKLIAISVASMPTKTVYQIGESFDESGLVVNALYDNSTSDFVTNYTVSGFDSETAGTKTIVVSYTNKGITKSCAFEITVEEPEDEGNFFTNFFNSILNFFMSIIEIFTSILGG